MVVDSERDLLAELAVVKRKHRLDVTRFDHDRDERVEPLLAKIGMAAHRCHGPITGDLATASFGGLERIREVFSTLAWIGLGQLAVVDGWLLARLLVPPKRGVKPRALATPAVATRFANRVSAAGESLLAGPLAREAAALVAAHAKALRPSEETAGRNGLACCIAAGILLYSSEHDLGDNPIFGALASAAEPASARATHVQHVTPPQELADAVLAAPLDDAPRLVLGDWLSEQGDPRRELIQVQCAVAAGPANVEALRARETALLKAHEKRWVEPFRASVQRWRFERGFPAWILADIGRFIDAHDTLAKLPLRVVRLTGYKPALLQKARRARPLPTVSGIDLTSNALKPSSLEVLASPLFERITALDLLANRFGDDGVAPLVAALPPEVVRLGLNDTKITAAGLAALSRAPRFAMLTHLSINSMGDDVLDALNRAESLEWLSLSSYELTRGAWTRLSLPRLTTLLFEGDPDGLEALLDAPGLPALQAVAAPRETPLATLAALDTRFRATQEYDLFG